MPAPFVLAIDVEPGPRYELTGAASEWDGFERCVAHIEPWRRVVLERTGQPLNVTWFMRCDPQVATYGHDAWALEHFGSAIRQLQNEGDEFGLHVHPYKRSPDGTWYQDFADADYVLETVRGGVAGFEANFRRLRYFRTGDGYMTGAIVALLDQLGVEFDLTVEPGRDTGKPFPAPDLGTMADYRRAPRSAYRPAYDDYLRPAGDTGRKLWMVPLATGCFSHPSRLHPASLGHRVEMMHLAFDARFFQPFVDYKLASRHSTVAVTRTGDVEWSPWLFDNFDYLFGHRDLPNVQFVSPAELVARRNAAVTA